MTCNGGSLGELWPPGQCPTERLHIAPPVSKQKKKEEKPKERTNTHSPTHRRTTMFNHPPKQHLRREYNSVAGYVQPAAGVLHGWVPRVWVTGPRCQTYQQVNWPPSLVLGYSSRVSVHPHRRRPTEHTNRHKHSIFRTSRQDLRDRTRC